MVLCFVLSMEPYSIFSFTGCSHFVIVLNLVACTSIDVQVRSVVGEREITLTVKLLNCFFRSKSHPGGFMQLATTAAAFYTSKVKSISDHKASMAVTVMILGLLMLKTVPVSCLYTLTKVVC